MNACVVSPLTFVACVNKPDVARRYLLASPCLRADGPHQLLLLHGMGSAGEGLAHGRALARHPWVVLLHQDVLLPEGWDRAFTQGLAQACLQQPALDVAGVYGLRADGSPAGHVIDRGVPLGASPFAPEPVRVLDELLLAVRRNSPVQADPGLGWHLYGADLGLQAEARGVPAMVVDALCEHHSTLPRSVQAADDTLRATVAAFNCSADRLAARWPQAMPLHTPVAVVGPGHRVQVPA